MSLFERIKNIRYDLQEKKKFSGDESGAYKRAKADIETKNLIKKAGGSGDIGFTAPKRKEKVLKRTTRAIKQGTPDPFDIDTSKAAKQTAKDFGTPTTSDIKKGKIPKGYTTPVSGFGKGITKGQANVKGLEAKAFKKTQPKDIKKTKGYKPYAQLSKDIQDLKKGTRDISTMNPSERQRAFGTSGSTEGAGGANTGAKPQKSKAQKFTDKINKLDKDRPESSGYSQANKPKPGSEPTVFKPKVSKTQVVNTTPFDPKSGSKPKGTRTITTTVPKKGQEYKPRKPRTITKTKTSKPSFDISGTKTSKPSFDISGTKYSPLKGPELPKFVTAKGDASFSKTGAGKGAIRIQKGATRSDINILRAGQKIAKKSGPAKGLVKTGSKILSKLGPKGRLAGLALTGFAASPFGRKTIGTLATAGGLTALFGGGKKEKQLKVGDGLKNVGKVRVTADSRGLKRNQADMAKIKATQKNFIDKYNKGRAFGKIKYNVNKQGTYDVIKPKKK